MSSPHGSSEPKDSPKSSKSVLSVSVSLQGQALEMIEQLSKPAQFKGEPIRVLDQDALNKLSLEIAKTLESKQVHTVSPIELSTLNAELAQMRLQLNLFKNKEEKAKFAEHTLKNDVVKLNKLLAEESKLREEQVKAGWAREAEAHAQLNELKKESASLKAKIGAAKTAKDTELLEQLNVQKRENGEHITRLNNVLQEQNKLKAENKSAIQRYQNQLLALTNELNLLKAKQEAELTKGTFAKVAAAAGTSAVNLASKIKSQLSEKSKWFLQQANTSDKDDVKNRAFWLNAVLENTNGVLLAPYKKLFGGLYEDIVALNFESRKQFGPIIDRFLDLLNGRINELTPEEIDAMLEEIDTSTMRMSKKYRENGILTFQQFLESGKKFSDLEDDALSVSAEQKLRDKVHSQKAKLPKRIKSKTTPSVKKGVSSVYTWCKSKIRSSIHYLLQTAHAEKEPERLSIRITEWLRRKVGFFGMVLSMPIALLSFISFSTW